MGERGPKFMGVPEEHKDFYANQFEEERAEGKEKAKGELEKVEKEFRMIYLVKKFLNAERINLGLSAKEIQHQQYHVMPTYNKPGGYFDVNEAIVVKRDLEHPLNYFKVIQHESTHAMSFVVLGLDDENQLLTRRSGYHLAKAKDSEIEQRFEGFNEGVTEKINIELLLKHRKEILKELRCQDEELTSPYVDLVASIDKIIEGVAAGKGQTNEEVWNKIKRGYFNGEIMHLRDIERSFGSDILNKISWVERNQEHLGVYHNATFDKDFQKKKKQGKVKPWHLRREKPELN